MREVHEANLRQEKAADEERRRQAEEAARRQAQELAKRAEAARRKEQAKLAKEARLRREKEEAERAKEAAWRARFVNCRRLNTQLELTRLLESLEFDRARTVRAVKGLMGLAAERPEDREDCARTLQEFGSYSVACLEDVIWRAVDSRVGIASEAIEVSIAAYMLGLMGSRPSGPLIRAVIDSLEEAQDLYWQRNKTLLFSHNPYPVVLLLDAAFLAEPQEMENTLLRLLRGEFEGVLYLDGRDKAYLEAIDMLRILESDDAVPLFLNVLAAKSKGGYEGVRPDDARFSDGSRPGFYVLSAAALAIHRMSNEAAKAAVGEARRAFSHCSQRVPTGVFEHTRRELAQAPWCETVNPYSSGYLANLESAKVLSVLPFIRTPDRGQVPIHTGPGCCTFGQSDLAYLGRRFLENDWDGIFVRELTRIEETLPKRLDVATQGNPAHLRTFCESALCMSVCLSDSAWRGIATAAYEVFVDGYDHSPYYTLACHISGCLSNPDTSQDAGLLMLALQAESSV